VGKAKRAHLLFVGNVPLPTLPDLRPRGGDLRVALDIGLRGMTKTGKASSLST
jgi:hypothetical protein